MWLASTDTVWESASYTILGCSSEVLEQQHDIIVAAARRILCSKEYSNPKSFVNFLLPDRGFGEGWGGVKNL